MDKEILVKHLATQLNLKVFQVANTIELLEQGATLPFISRYRKEKTGSLDEVAIMHIQDGWKKLTELESRRAHILQVIGDQGKLSAELAAKIESTLSAVELEDLYLPYKQKKKTRAVKAREAGLEPLAKILMAQKEYTPEKAAERFVCAEVPTVQDALTGARDIMAEWINEHLKVRQNLRRLFDNEALIVSSKSRKADEENNKYENYFSHQERLKKCPSHRYLAIMRGESEGQLTVSVAPDQEKAVRIIEGFFVRADNPSSDQVRLACTDAYRRLLAPSLENEIRSVYKEKADQSAIGVFAENLEQLLLMPPLGQKRILAVDPGFRTGCKVVCLSAQGALLHNETIFPHPPQNERRQAARKLSALADTYKIDAIAIGNGTASRETEEFVQRYVSFTRKVQVFVVNESGASVYSASPVAREEFPDFDVTVRGAVSIGRRLMDPLAELVKIDPKSIGVGQYQHDVDQRMLHDSLHRVIEKCVNKVGVHVNTAGKYLLQHVSGLGPQLATNIEQYIRENGPIRNREQLLSVPRMGKKAFELAAGFLRIPDSDNPLDNSAVHPERYPLVTQMASDLNASVDALIADRNLISRIDPQRYLHDEVGLPTIQDILEELEKPGRDPRGVIRVFEFDPRIHVIDDLEPGMVLPGIVTNITDFGAFVDLGVKQDGLVHVSQMVDRYIRHPNEVVRINQQLMVKVLQVDTGRSRIQLSMLGVEQQGL